MRSLQLATLALALTVGAVATANAGTYSIQPAGRDPLPMNFTAKTPLDAYWAFKRLTANVPRDQLVSRTYCQPKYTQHIVRDIQSGAKAYAYDKKLVGTARVGCQ